MSAESCTCTDPKMPNLGIPRCVVRRKKTAFIGIMSRYQADGTRNVIDVSSATLGADIVTKSSASTGVLSRIFWFPRMEEITYPRTETKYQTMASDKKFKLDGEGGVRSFMGQLMGDNGVEQVARELQKLGCIEFDFIQVSVDGNIWGTMDDSSVAELRGMAVEKETFDAFLNIAVDGAINNIPVSFDLEDDLDMINAYAITADELGYRATTLRPLIQGTCTAVEASTTTIEATVVNGFGSAVIPGTPITGLLVGNFTVTANGTPVTVTVAENTSGVYTLTFAEADIDPADEVIVAVSATGYDVTSGTYTSVS